MSHSNTSPVSNRAPLTARSSSLLCVSAAEHHTAEQYSVPCVGADRDMPQGSGDWLDIPGYTVYPTMKADRKDGGVSIQVKSHLSSLLLPEFSLTTNQFELRSVCITVNSKEYNIEGVYRSPCINDFNNTFFNFINDTYVVNKLCVVLGDFNIHLLPQILPPCSDFFITDFSLFILFQQ